MPDLSTDMEQKRAQARGNGVYIGEDRSAAPRPAADGYVRKSPVQGIRVPADYGRRRAARVAMAAFTAIAVLTAVYVFFSYVLKVSPF